ncbi:MAG: DUF4258 domain-containing protein [Anaerolineales bacterium]|nr:DUF4258 domain-containing protein [Anaerolineales bacterium]
MKIRFHPHALERLAERGATEEEVRAAIELGEKFPAKFERFGFRRNFPYDSQWRGRFYPTKQVEVFAVEESPQDWLVITVITRFF